MKTWNYKKIFVLLLLVWFLLNLVQSFFAEILADEAYYAVWAKYLDWGYFDHPPMVALIIRISSLFFNGTLGVRFMSAVMQAATVWTIWKTIGDTFPSKDRVITFFIIASSICMFHFYGIITTPDVPLLFFTALFLYSYKEFIKSDRWINVLLLSISMAGMFYSKYHALLIIGFVVLSNIRILKAYRFWIAGVFAIMLLSPHIYWQFANGFPSFRYHLIDRSDSFRWIYLLEYIPNQMAVFNPLILGAVFYVLIKKKPSDLFERALYFLIIGFIAFFWLTAFRGHVEPHWTVACSIGMIILLYRQSINNAAMHRFIRKFVLPSIFLIFLIRIYWISGHDSVRRLGFDGRKEEYEFIHSEAGDLPVLFVGSFQRASMYRFFTGGEATANSSLYSRLTQYDLWQFERNYRGKVFVAGYEEDPPRVFEKDGFRINAFISDSVQTVNRVKVDVKNMITIGHIGDSLNLIVSFSNTYDYDIDFNHKKFPVQPSIVFIKDKLYLDPVEFDQPIGVIKAGETVTRKLSTIIPKNLPGGKFVYGICLQNQFGPSINESLKTIKVSAE